MNRITLFVVLGFCASADIVHSDVGITINCEVENSSSTIQCTIENTSHEQYVVLTSPFVLEGPKGGSDYIYKHPGGARVENTLEYGYPSKGPLGRKVLFFPRVDLEREDLDSLCRLEPGGTARVSIMLKDVTGVFAERSDWIMRPKIVAAKKSNLEVLLHLPDLDDQCKSHLRDALLQGCRQVIEPGVVAPWKGIQYKEDGCLDIISEQFEHFFAEQLGGAGPSSPSGP